MGLAVAAKERLRSLQPRVLLSSGLRGLLVPPTSRGGVAEGCWRRLVSARWLAWGTSRLWSLASLIVLTLAGCWLRLLRSVRGTDGVALGKEGPGGNGRDSALDRGLRGCVNFGLGNTGKRRFVGSQGSREKKVWSR